MQHPFPKSASMSARSSHLHEIVGVQDRLAVLINADPDALASALALKRIYWRKTKKIDICHIKPIERADNLSMVHLLDIRTRHIDKLDRSKYTKWALLDSQPDHHPSFRDFQFDIIIDHHPLTEGLSALHLDISEDYGANSSLMTEYLKAEKIKPSPRLATALFYGIKTDTHNFVGDSAPADINAFRYLYRFSNMNVVKKIESSELTLTTLHSYRRAMENLTIIDHTAVVHMGRVNETDTLVMLADFFLKLAEASAAIVSGVSSGKLIVILRNAGFRQDAGKLAQQLFGDFGTAGGHRSAARAEVPLENIKSRFDCGGAYGEFVSQRLKKTIRGSDR